MTIGASIKRKAILVPYEDTRRRVSNNTIKKHATNSKSYITHNGEGQTLENHDSKYLKYGSEHQD